MRIDPATGQVEIAGVLYARTLQRTRAATEAIHLTMRHAFDDLGYRRFEWKCDSLNEPSRRAAYRLGFRYEGRFRNHMVTKGHNRDTDWFSVTDAEWPAVQGRARALAGPGELRRRRSAAHRAQRAHWWIRDSQSSGTRPAGPGTDWASGRDCGGVSAGPRNPRSVVKSQNQSSPGSKLVITGCPVARQCAVACWDGEVSQQPM